MDSTLRSFDKRQKALRRKHQRMARGYVNKLDRSTGLISQTPDQKAGGIGLRVLVIALVGFMLFKSFLLAGLGETAYLENIAALQAGSGFEKAGAWAMQIDPVTAFLGEKLTPLLQSLSE